MTDTIRVTGPAGALRNIPGLVGFIPTDSLVIVFMTDAGVVRCTTRIDLDSVLDDPDYLVGFVHDVSDKAAATAIIPTLWTEQMPTENALAGVMMALTVLDQGGIKVYDLLWTNGEDVYSSYHCTDPTCCPASISYGASEIELMKGEAVARTRDDLATALSCTVPVPFYEDVDPDPVALVTELRASQDDPSILDDSLALLFRSTTQYSAWSRDTFIRLYSLGVANGDVEALSGARIEHLAQRVPDGEGKALGVLALLAVMAGDGAAAQILAARCPDDSLGRLSDATATGGIPPVEVIAMFAGIDQARIDEGDPAGRV